MELVEAIKARHSVRRFTDQKIEGEVLRRLQETVDACNRESGLHIQLCLEEPQAFAGMMARMGSFRNVRNYLALVGKPEDGFEEACGYYGEKIVLRATQLGLHSCWVALTYSKGKCSAQIGADETLKMVIAIGYGVTNGASHKVKPIEKLCRVDGEMPAWFRSGVEAAQLAPTAVNQQKFCFTLQGNTVHASPGSGFHTKVDLGIAKYHFEIGAGAADWNWGQD